MTAPWVDPDDTAGYVPTPDTPTWKPTLRPYPVERAVLGAPDFTYPDYLQPDEALRRALRQAAWERECARHNVTPQEGHPPAWLHREAS